MASPRRGPRSGSVVNPVGGVGRGGLSTFLATAWSFPSAVSIEFIQFGAPDHRKLMRSGLESRRRRGAVTSDRMLPSVMRSKRNRILGADAIRRVWVCLLGTILAMAMAGAPARAAERVATAIVFAVDVSGSVNTERYELQRTGIAGIFADERIEQFLTDGLAVTVMEWSDGHTVVVPWTILRTPADAFAFADRINAVTRSPGFSTELSLALFAAADLLDVCPCEAASRIIDVSGDGQNNGPVSTNIVRNEVVARGIRINGLPIVTPIEPDLARWYAANVVGGAGAFMEGANGFEDFARAMRRKFQLEVAGLEFSVARVRDAPQIR